MPPRFSNTVVLTLASLMIALAIGFFVGMFAAAPAGHRCCSGSRRSSRLPPPGATATRRSACGTWARRARTLPAGGHETAP